MLTTKPVSSVTKVLVSVALLTASSTPAFAGAAACQAGQPGCVLPVAEPAPPPPPPAEAPPPVAVVEQETKGIGVWPIILGIAALAGLAFLLLDDDDDEDEVSP